MRVDIVQTTHKGIGVVARHALAPGIAIARYEFKVVKRALAPPGDFRVEVDRKHVGKIDARSFAPPIGAVANVGALLNEPDDDDEGETPNCRSTPTQFWGTPARRRGAFILKTTRAVAAGEELTWAYGPNYRRAEYHRRAPGVRAARA